MPRRSKQKFVPYSTTGSRLANLDDGTWAASIRTAPQPRPGREMPEQLNGEPPVEIRLAIHGFIGNELSKSTMLAFRFNINRDTIIVNTNPRFTDHKGKAVFQLYATCIHLHSNKKTQTIDYADPEMFDQIERFINLWIL